jgi:hypothetical protein
MLLHAYISFSAIAVLGCQTHYYRTQVHNQIIAPSHATKLLHHCIAIWFLFPVSLAAHPLHALRNQAAWEPRQAMDTAGFLERGFQRAWVYYLEISYTIAILRPVNPELKYNLLFWFVYFCTSVYFKTSEKKIPTDSGKISEEIFPNL